MKKKDIINLVVLIIVIFAAGYSYYNKTYKYERDAFLLDTAINVRFESKHKKDDALMNALLQKIKAADSVFSYYKKDSEVWEINHSQKDSLKVSDDIINMLTIGAKLYMQSDSLYDLSIGELTDIWDFEKRIIPSKAKIDSVLKNIGFYKIKIGNDFIIKDKNIKLNFGSIAKGLIIDKAVTFLKNNKIKKGIVNAGGDIKIFGYKKPILIGIQHPRKKTGEVIATIKLKNCAVVTSGDYERYFIKNGVRYHHILNPKTGFPAKESISVTVIADNAIIADAYSTALFLLNPNKAIKLAKNTPDIDAIIFYQKNGKIFYKKSFGTNKYSFKIIDNNIKEEE